MGCIFTLDRPRRFIAMNSDVVDVYNIEATYIHSPTTSLDFRSPSKLGEVFLFPAAWNQGYPDFKV